MLNAQIACCYAMPAPPCVDYSLQCRRVEARHKHIQFVPALGTTVVCRTNCMLLWHASTLVSTFLDHNWLTCSRIGLRSNVEVWRHGVRTCNLCNSYESPWNSYGKLQVLRPCLHLHVRFLISEIHWRNTLRWAVKKLGKDRNSTMISCLAVI